MNFLVQILPLFFVPTVVAHRRGFVVQPLSCSLTLFFASGVAWPGRLSKGPFGDPKFKHSIL